MRGTETKVSILLNSCFFQTFKKLNLIFFSNLGELNFTELPLNEGTGLVLEIRNGRHRVSV